MSPTEVYAMGDDEFHAFDRYMRDELNERKRQANRRR